MPVPVARLWRCIVLIRGAGLGVFAVNINDYTPAEQDELKAISACMASIEKLEILSARINKTDRSYIAKDIAALKANLEGTEI